MTLVEVMPVNAFPGVRNWGYDGVLPSAVQESYGGPDGFARFVDAAHAHGLGVVLDVVYNHFGPEGNVLAAFGPYFTEAYDTPWGAAVNVAGPGSDDV
ncbi:MAG: alpha-amylase family glycosyl hydrolase, partial [Ilumatobacter sp.]